MAWLTPGLCPSYTFQQVQQHTDQIWKFQRHDLIEEYHGRPPAPPPFILLNHLQILVQRGLLCRPATCHRQLSEDQHLSSCPSPPPWVHGIVHQSTQLGVRAVLLGFGVPKGLTTPSLGRREAGEERRSCTPFLGDVSEGELPAEPAVPGEAEHGAKDPKYCTKVPALLRQGHTSVLQRPRQGGYGIRSGVAAEGVPLCTVPPGLTYWQSSWTWTG